MKTKYAGGVIDFVSRAAHKVTESPVGELYNTFWPAISMLHHGEHGLKPHDNLTFNHLVQNTVGLPIPLGSFGDKPVPIVDSIYRNLGKPILDKGIQTFQRLPEKHQNSISTAYNIGSKVLDTTNLVSFGSSFLPHSKPNPQISGIKAMERQLPERSTFDQLMHTKAFDRLENKNRNEVFNKNELSDIPKYLFSGATGITGAGALETMDRSQKRASTIREAHPLEIPHLFDLCLDSKKEFMINSDATYKMAADRMLHQDTYLSGDLMNLKGFINGGFRELPGTKTASVPYYIRFVYVNPEHGGKGVAGSMIEDLIQKSGSTSAWIQICSDNKKMQKVASKLGFKKLYSFSQAGALTDVLTRGI